MANVEYKGQLLSTNSRAYEILTKDKDEKALTKHLKELDNQAKSLLTLYDRFEHPITVTEETDNDSEPGAIHTVYSPHMIAKLPFLETIRKEWEAVHDMVVLTVGELEFMSNHGPIYLQMKGTDFLQGRKIRSTVMIVGWLESKSPPGYLYSQVLKVLPPA